MKNEFKNYFDLNKSFEGLKIHNDFLNTRKFNSGKIGVMMIVSFSAYLIMRHGLYFIANYDTIWFNLKYRFNTRYTLLTSKGANVNVDKLLSDYSKFLADFDDLFIKLNDESIKFSLGVLYKELLKLNHLRREKNCELSEDDKVLLFKNTLNEVVKVLGNSIDHLDVGLLVLHTLFDFYIPTGGRYSQEDVRMSVNKFLSFCNGKQEMFAYLIMSDFDSFYQLKKIAKIIEKNKLSENEKIICLKQIIKTEENKLKDYTRFI